MLFLYELPDWLIGVTVLTAFLALAHAGYFAFHRVCRTPFTDENKSVAIAVLTVVATINSLLLAFAAVSVWEAYREAEAAVVEEAESVSELALDLAIYDSAESREARRMLREYTEMVVKVEWQSMQRGEANVDVWQQFDRLFLVVGTLEPDTPRRSALLPEIWARTNELVKLRRSRLYTSEAKVSGTLWSVILIGTVVSMLTSYVLPRTPFNLWMIGTLAVSFGLVFFLVIVMDRPFAGQEGITPEPMQTAISNMERWDAETARPAPAK
jgi:hypothetical protein